MHIPAHFNYKYIFHFLFIFYFDPDNYINRKIVRQRYLRVKLAEAIKGKPCFSRRKINLWRLTNKINIHGANKARIKAQADIKYNFC